MQDTFLLCPVLLALVADIDKPLLGIGVRARLAWELWRGRKEA